MNDSDLLAFTPVPLRARADGWTGERQRAFIDYVRKGLRPGAAARLVGMSRQTAYALRGRPGAESFAAAWDRAVTAAIRRRAAHRRSADWTRAVEGVRRPVRYRGRVVATDVRCDDAALLRLLRRADRFLEKRGTGGDDYFPLGDMNFCQLSPPPDAKPRKIGG